MTLPSTVMTIKRRSLMSKKIECRLPEDLYGSLKKFAKEQGVTITDIVVAGINLQLYPEPRLYPEAPAKKPGKKRVKEAQPITPVPEPEPVQEAIEPPITNKALIAALQEKAAAKPWFNPCTKESQTYNKGKE
jgi:hypothetical protein